MNPATRYLPTSLALIALVGASAMANLPSETTEVTKPAPTPVNSLGEPAPLKPFTTEQLDELLGPIALYPDALVAQILAASTYPVELVIAARWTREHPKLEGLDSQPWDPSVIAVAHFPTVVQMIDDRLQWTADLGRAFLNQPQDVMDRIQALRAKATAVGALADTPEQRIVVEEQVIRIVPAQPDVIYVPMYDPAVVYVSPPYGSYYYPYYSYYPYYPYYPYYASSYVTFGIGFAFGSWLFLDCDWHHHHLCFHDHHHHHGHHDHHGVHHDGHHSEGHTHFHGAVGVVVAGAHQDGDVWKHNPDRHPGAWAGNSGRRAAAISTSLGSVRSDTVRAPAQNTLPAPPGARSGRSNAGDSTGPVPDRTPRSNASRKMYERGWITPDRANIPPSSRPSPPPAAGPPNAAPPSRSAPAPRATPPSGNVTPPRAAPPSRNAPPPRAAPAPPSRSAPPSRGAGNGGGTRAPSGNIGGRSGGGNIGGRSGAGNAGGRSGGGNIGGGGRSGGGNVGGGGRSGGGNAGGNGGR